MVLLTMYIMVRLDLDFSLVSDRRFSRYQIFFIYNLNFLFKKNHVIFFFLNWAWT